MKAELLYDIKATLGEGPVWDARTGTLYWIDILGKRIYANADIFLETDETIGCLSLRKDGGLIFTKRASIWTREPDSSQLTLLSSLTDEPADNRFNDGKCDPHGRFLAGTMDMEESGPNGALYSFDGASTTRLFDSVTISNGLTWSPDYKTLYYIDTPSHEVKAFDYELENGKLENMRVAFELSETLGHPDGMTSDTQGNLWIAMWGGAKVTKWNPNTGQLLEQIPVPAKNVSSCVFGGKNLNELFITSARVGLDEDTLKQYPLTGGVFRLETDVEGMPSFEFTG
ncbi:MAG TPA: SMP-30/gluconolactonase/LRE family protein [Anaerolineales bacterium]|nr:SMP-30/gluconolactonase/LRE family protein [Anaerolineales bacterium]